METVKRLATGEKHVINHRCIEISILILMKYVTTMPITHWNALFTLLFQNAKLPYSFHVQSYSTMLMMRTY